MRAVRTTVFKLLSGNFEVSHPAGTRCTDKDENWRGGVSAKFYPIGAPVGWKLYAILEKRTTGARFLLNFQGLWHVHDRVSY